MIRISSSINGGKWKEIAFERKGQLKSKKRLYEFKMEIKDSEAETMEEAREEDISRLARAEEDDANMESRPPQQSRENEPPGLSLFLQPNNKPLDVDLVVTILKNVEKYSSVACDTIPTDPKAGNVFLFIPTREEEQGSLA